MGRFNRPVSRAVRRTPDSLSSVQQCMGVMKNGSVLIGRRLRVAALGAVIALGCASSPLLTLPASAQTLADRIASKPKKTGAPDRMLVEAKEMVYNDDKKTVSAVGDAQVYYQGKILEADRVIYDQVNKRVYAEGNAKMTEADGTVSYGERFEFSDNFRDGFIDTLRTDTKDRTHFSAPRGERVDGNATIFEKGTYTACDACKEDPSKPQFWRVRAKRIIHKNAEQTIYYEDATLELMGVPIAYLPYFSAPDPSVKRKSGILSPHYTYNQYLGAGIGIPMFWALAPNYDLTATPTYYVRQGFLGDVEWRHRLATGAYNIRGSGIFQNAPQAFDGLVRPGLTGRFRGSIESKGQFYITDKWKFGWDFIALSDRYYLSDYHRVSQTVSSNYLSESTSTLYLSGQGDRGYFDMRGYYFRGLSTHDFQKQQPIVHPVIDYNKTIDIDPNKSAGIGGQVEIDFNMVSLSTTAAAFESTGARTLDKAGFYDVCLTYTRANCLLRGIGGDYTRATLNLSWKRKYIDELGQVWTPFVFAHMNAAWVNYNNTQQFAIYNGANVPITNADQANFLGGRSNTFQGQLAPGFGLEYRYPIHARTSFASMIFEPIAQIVVRPNEPIRNAMLNMDAQSLVFDDTTLFDWNKYSGYDRFEGGTRANLGVQHAMKFNNGATANFTLGQSFQVAGRNSYATPDAANVGLSSGLDTRRSDYVAAASFAPSSNFAFTAKGRFDPQTFQPRRMDLIATANYGSILSSIQYARYEAQPLIGYDKRREGLASTTRWNITNNYYVQGNVVFDLSRHLHNNDLDANGVKVNGNAGLFSIASLGFGAGYQDECTTFAISYSSSYSTAQQRNQTVLLQLQLRTLGDVKFKTDVGSLPTTDGLTNAKW